MALCVTVLTEVSALTDDAEDRKSVLSFDVAARFRAAVVVLLAVVSAPVAVAVPLRIAFAWDW